MGGGFPKFGAGLHCLVQGHLFSDYPPPLGFTPTHKDLIVAFCVDFPTYHKWVVHQSSLVFMRSHLFVVAFEVAE
jgi:hypothetical protein